MTKKIIYSYKDFEPKQSHSYLFDTSVLLFPFAPIGSYKPKLQSSISTFLSRCKSIGSEVNTTSLIISEFANKVFKDFFEEFKKNHPEPDKFKIQLKKDYRPNKQYLEDNLILRKAIKNILAICERYPDDFHQINIDSILNNTIEADYNDAYFIELANRNNWIIVSRDKDIINHPNLETSVISFLD